MALSSIESRLTSGIPHQTCAVCHYMAERGEQWASTLRRLLADRGVRFKDLELALQSDPDEPDIHRDTLSRHARGLCSARDVLR